jgi:hypothetical protein
MSGSAEQSREPISNLQTESPLNISRFTIAYRVTENAWLSSFDGMAWQSAFEPLLRQNLCFSKCEQIANCDFRTRCLYHRLFLKDLDSEHVPPYNFYPQSGMRAKKWQKGDHFYLGLNMVGRIAFFLDAFLPALEGMGRIPLGSSGGRVVLSSITQHLQNGRDVDLYQRGQMGAPSPPEPIQHPSTPDSIWVNLETPLRLRGNKGVVRVPTFTGEMFGQAIEQRFRDLSSDSHSGDFGHEWPEVRNVNLKWLPSKQPTRRGMNWSPLNTAGLIGKFELSGKALQAVWPLLWQGQFLNLGEEAHLGLGRYSLTV